jgi:hypothetical protein
MRLFGPVFLFNLARLARQRKFFVFRFLFGLLLLFLLGIISLEYRVQLAVLRSAGDDVHLRQMWADLMVYIGERFFLLFLGVQAVVVILLTPGCVATALSEEKQSRQLELLLTTDVSIAEIVLGKLLSRLGMVFQLVLAGLPVISLLQLFGGVEPALIWAGYAATLLLLFSLGSMSILCSLYADTTLGAFSKCYLVPIIYCLLLWGLPYLHFTLDLFNTGPQAQARLQNVIGTLEAGNPLTAVQELRHHMQVVGQLGDKPWELLQQSAWFHGTVIVVSLLLTILRLRRVYLRYVAKDHLPVRRLRKYLPWRRPRMKERPILWKECHSGGKVRLSLLWHGVCILGALVVAFAALVVATDIFLKHNAVEACKSLNLFLRMVGPALLGLALLQVGVAAASTLHGEQQRLTWDSLVMTLIPLRGILAGKWWGSIYAARFLLGVLVFLILLGVVTGSLHPLSAVLMAVITMGSCAFAATLGIYLAVYSRTHFRAVFWVLLLLLQMNLLLPYLSPKTWAFAVGERYFYPSTPHSSLVEEMAEKKECAYRETLVALGLRSLSPVNLWQTLALMPKEVQSPEMLDDRYEWQNHQAHTIMSDRTYFRPAGGWPLVPRQSLANRVGAFLAVLLLGLVIDRWLWRSAVRKLMLQLERVDEYPIRYWLWPPGA